MYRGSWGTNEDPIHIVTNGKYWLESFYDAKRLPSNDPHYTDYTNLRDLFQKALTELESKNIEMDKLLTSRKKATDNALNARRDFFNLTRSIPHFKKERVADERSEVPKSLAAKERPISHRDDTRSASASAPEQKIETELIETEPIDAGGSRTRRTRRTRRSRRSIKTRRTRI